MTFSLKTLGYYLLDHNHLKDGFAGTSLEQLVAAGHESKLPLLDGRRLNGLQNGRRVPTERIWQHNLPSWQEKITWAPTSRFLYEMHKQGRFEDLGIPKTKMLVTANRKTIQRIMILLRGSTEKSAQIRTKMKLRNYGKELLVSYEDKKMREFYRNGWRNNSHFGLNFNFYLLEFSTERREHTLFSIHLLEMGNTCVVYEAEIDAIERTQEDENSPWVYSIVEVKTTKAESERAVSMQFEKYVNGGCMYGNKEDRVNAQLSKRCIKKSAGSVTECILQGELGNVSKFVYGFTSDAMEWRGGSGYVTARTYPCLPGIWLNRKMGNLADFVALLENTPSCNGTAGMYWEQWRDWLVIKDVETVRLYNKGPAISSNDLLGELQLWSLVPKRKRTNRKKQDDLIKDNYRFHKK